MVYFDDFILFDARPAEAGEFVWVDEETGLDDHGVE